MNTTQMTENLQDWQKRATKTCKDLTETTNRYVRENTWSSLAMAAVLGCLVGYLLMSRRD